jgi:hypothetical protein
MSSSMESLTEICDNIPPRINESITPFALSLIKKQWEMATHADFDERRVLVVLNGSMASHIAISPPAEKCMGT